MVKKKLGLTLITFEDANIDLEPFIRVHPFETVNFLTHAVLHHYQDELLSQAVLILGKLYNHLRELGVNFVFVNAMTIDF